MASFVVSTIRGAGVELAASRDHFEDDDGDVHEASIDKAAEAGLALGVGSTRFAPRDPVRRNQMASFVVRLAQQLATGAR